MFLRIVDVYLILKHSNRKPKLFAIKINIDLEVRNVEVKIHIYGPFLPHFYPIWIEHSGGNVEPQPLITPEESKTDGAGALGVKTD